MTAHLYKGSRTALTDEERADKDRHRQAAQPARVIVNLMARCRRWSQGAGLGRCAAVKARRRGGAVPKV